MKLTYEGIGARGRQALEPDRIGTQLATTIQLRGIIRQNYDVFRPKKPITRVAAN